VSKGDVVAFVGLVNPLDVAQTVELEVLLEGGTPTGATIALAPKSRKGIALEPYLPATGNFGLLVHFSRQGVASLTLRRLGDFFGASALTVPGQQFCRQEGL
jgi:hypothetical protein